MVPPLSLIFMILAMLAGVALPVGLFLYFSKKQHCDDVPFFIGCAVMLVFALILESAVHRAVLGSAAGARILASTALYALYGGLMAGLFEETGRFLAFRTVLKKYQDKDRNALMYGAGHGGFEALAVLSLTMLNNLVISVLVNAGRAGLLTGSLSGDALAQAEAAIAALTATPPWAYLAGIVERLSAIALHLSFSVLVWFAVKARKWVLYPLSVLLHAAVDALTVILSRNGVNIWLIELTVAILAAACAVPTVRVWRACHVPPEESERKE